MSSLVNWENLKPYRSNQNKSFEELCYQLIYEECSSQGILTPIDDSGGGDGVEFYLTFPNGDVWGWQCKFFGRLNEGGRKTQIKKSLQKAYDTHGGNLKKWVLCSKLSFTNEERDWFFSQLPTLTHGGRVVLPEEHSVELDHLGDTKINNLLRKYPDIHRYFFTDKVLDLDWFNRKFTEISNTSVIKTKYLNGLHVSVEADEAVIRTLADPRLSELIQEGKDILEVDRFLNEYEEGISKISKDENIFDFKEDYYKIKKFVLSNDRPTIISRGNDLLSRIQEILVKEEPLLLAEIFEEVTNYKKELEELYSGLSKFRSEEVIPSFHWDTEDALTEDTKENSALKSKIKKCRETALSPYFTLRSFFRPYINLFHNLEYKDLNELHISGKASKGKTHLAVNIVEHQIERNKPAIFLFGKDFRGNNPLKEQLKGLLDLPTDWSVSDFLGALNISGRVNKTKAILLIDGLNESIHWKHIWGSNLEMLIGEINQNYPNILLITTYRESYEKELFPEDYFLSSDENWLKKTNVYGFEGESLNDAIERYFKYYNITLGNRSSAVHHFKEPLYLKIFCEAKQGQEVSFQNEDLFDVFDQYLEKSNKSVVKRLGLNLRYNKTFSQEVLSKISQKLWDDSRRDIDLTDVIPNMLNEEQLVAFEGEDLLIFRDWGDQEVVTFTYDLLSGYLIAKVIIQDIDSESELITFLNSEKFVNELTKRETLHPLYHDIIRCFCVLVVKKFGLSSYVSEIDDNVKEFFIRALFEINTSIIAQNSEVAIKLVSDYFTIPKKRRLLYYLFSHTQLDPKHPLNFNLLSKLIFEMPVSDRDISWTEYVRREYDSQVGRDLEGFLKSFEKACKEKWEFTERIHIAAKKVMWFLTSTDREIRDKATRALYYYGRALPNKFFELVEYSLKINDPYVWERTLVSLYGVVLAEHNSWESDSFREEVLPVVGRRLYELMFAPNAPYSTTHILARDYAFSTINICRKHHPTILNEGEVRHITPPFTFGGIRDWGEFDYGQGDFGYEKPIRMDFSNYTIGSIVPNGHSYSNPPEKQKVRRQIYWRIYDLGWELERFQEIEKRIGDSNYSYSRSEKPKIERYGKKYSWIAFFEVFGYREDNDLVRDDWPNYRTSKADIDPTFPELPENKQFIKEDFLGDREIPLADWLENHPTPELDKYLQIENLEGNEGEWVCLDGFLSQRDKNHNREQFVFIRGILVKEEDSEEFIDMFNLHDSRHDRIPRVHQNHYTFAGEMNTIESSTYDNISEMSFEIKRVKRTIKKGEPGYYPRTIFAFNEFSEEYPDEIVTEDIISKDFEVLMPVSEYSWEGYHSSINQAGGISVVAKEISFDLNLVNVPQTFNLFEKDGALASLNIRYYVDLHTSQNFVYLRKDLLTRFLEDNKYKLVWGIWGERQITSTEYGEVRKIAVEMGVSEVYRTFRIIKNLSDL